jgi:hypothetical protein
MAAPVGQVMKAFFVGQLKEVCTCWTGKIWLHRWTGKKGCTYCTEKEIRDHIDARGKLKSETGEDTVIRSRIG